jgi:HlyD family secretion protein
MTTTRTRALVLGTLAVIGLGAALFVYLRRDAAPLAFQGWVEAYFVFVSADESGRIEALSVREGDTVAEAAPLFSLDADLQRAAVAETEAAVINARQAYERAKALLVKNVGSQKVFEDAEAALRTAEARLNSARTRLERRRVASPAAGSVQEVYYRVGEMVQAGRPIVSLLPPGKARVRFFVPQATLAKVHIGERIAVSCDGCAGEIVARVSFISAQAEFTPPVIYSQEERARLVFRVEAIPERGQDVRVGQPVSVTLQPAPSVSHAQK